MMVEAIQHFEICGRNEVWLRTQYEFAAASGKPCCVVTIKLKEFRKYMHTEGETRTQETLQAVYAAMASCLEEGESLARISGCYFVAILYVPREIAQLRARARALHFSVHDIMEHRFEKQLYLGMGFYPVTDPSVSFFDAQYYADLCRVESAQQNYDHSHYEFYGISYTDAKQNFLKLEKIMEESLVNGDFKLYLQPKVNLRTGEVTCAEALMRWIHPERGMIPLSDFLKSFDENGFIRDVGLYLFEIACDYMRRWVHKMGKQINISFNFSKAYLGGDYFERQYMAAFDKYNLPKECVRIELLESIVSERRAELKSITDRLYQNGFTCSVDDFGSGFSSLSMLTTIRLSELKIDRSLFQNENSEAERILVWRIVEIAHDLELSVVAEGVETQGYADYLREIGCDFVQGFFYYRPMPVEEFERRFVLGNERVDLHTGVPIAQNL